MFLPGVNAAAVSNAAPFAGNYNDSVILAESYQAPPGESLISPHIAGKVLQHVRATTAAPEAAAPAQPADAPDAAAGPVAAPQEEGVGAGMGAAGIIERVYASGKQYRVGRRTARPSYGGRLSRPPAQPDSE